MEQSRSTSPTIVDRLDLADRVVDFLRREHPTKTAEHVADATGLKIATVRRLLERHSAPSARALYLLTAAYGASFLSAVFGFAWIDEAAGWERQRTLEASIAAQSAELARMREGRP